YLQSYRSVILYCKLVLIISWSACKRQPVFRCTIAFLWYTKKVLVNLVVAVCVMKNEQGISTRGHIAENSLCSFVFCRYFYTLKGFPRFAFKRLCAIKQASPTNSLVIF